MQSYLAACGCCFFREGFTPLASSSFSRCLILILAMSNSCLTFQMCVSQSGSRQRWRRSLSVASYTAPRKVKDLPMLCGGRKKGKRVVGGSCGGGKDVVTVEGEGWRVDVVVGGDGR